MTDRKISELGAIPNISPDSDIVPIVDVDASQTKSTTVKDLVTSVVSLEVADYAALDALTSGVEVGENIRRTDIDQLYTCVTSGGHITTTGGFSFNVVVKGCLLLDAFNVSYGTGVSSSDRVSNLSSIQAAAQVRDELGCKLVANGGRLEIEGSSNITFRGNVDLSNVVLGVENFTGYVEHVHDTATTTYTGSDAELVALQSTTTAQAGSSVWDGWETTSGVSDAMVEIVTSDDFFSYRGSTEVRKEWNVHMANGVFQYPLKYALTPANITSAKVQPLNKEWYRFNPPVFDVSGSTATRTLRVNSSRLRLGPTTFLNSGTVDISTPRLLQLIDCAHVIVEGVSTSTPVLNYNGVNYVSSYTINPVRCVDLTVKDARSEGEGWGVVGCGEGCVDIKYVRCHLNRIDNHEPFFHKLTIDSCEIGTWGIVLSGVGDVLIKDTTLTMRDYPNLADFNSSPKLLSSRNDTSGFVDGDLVVRNLTVRGPDVLGSGSMRLLENQGDSLEAIPVSSPIVDRRFKRISIDGLFNESDFQIEVDPAYTDDNTHVLPESVSYRNFRGDFEYTNTWTGRTSTGADTYDIEFIVDDCDYDTFSIVDAGFTLDVSLTVRDLRQKGSGSVLPFFRGDATLVGGEASKLDLFEGSSITGPLNLTWYSPTLRDDGTGTFINAQISDGLDAKLVDAKVYLATGNESRFYQGLRLKWVRPSVFVNNSLVDFEVAPAASSGVFTLNQSRMSVGQKITLVSGASGSSNGDMFYTFNLPDTNDKIGAFVYDDTAGSMATVLIERSFGTLTVSGYGTANLKQLILEQGSGNER